MLFVSLLRQSLNPDMTKNECGHTCMYCTGQTDLGLNGFSTAQRSGLTLKPCSMRPMVKGNAPPVYKAKIEAADEILYVHCTKTC